jgi:AAA+ superfamily predicted ATPase
MGGNMDTHRDALHRQLERWQLNVVRAQAARSGTSSEAEVAALDDDFDVPDAGHERMSALAGRMHLDDTEIDLVWWIIANAVDATVMRGAEALGARGRRGSSIATFSEVAQLSDEVARELAIRVATGHRLITTGLVRAPDGEIGAGSALVPSSRLVSYLLGDDTTDSAVERIDLHPAQRPHCLYDVEQLTTMTQLAELVAPMSRAVIIVEGPPRTGRRTAVAYCAHRAVLSIDFERLASAQAIASALRALERELVLTDAVPVLANVSIDRAAHDVMIAIASFVDAHPGPVVLTSGHTPPTVQTSRPLVRLRWNVPGTEVRCSLWQQALGAAQLGREIESIAMRYRLGPGGIRRAVASGRAARPSGTGLPLTPAELIAGVRHNIAEGMAGIATRVEVTQTWDDVVLAEDTLDQVQGLVARLRHAHLVLERWGFRAKLARGAGVAALFSGPPGTGKTMVAGLIARELDLELYQVDLSQVVSKWVGETEKQLARVFDGAEAGHALLLFDEADALFGQRSTEMRGAVDRYANLEVNFLLQRIEAFGGITILTTNLDAAIDKALKRRLAGHIVFGSPDDEERVELWRRLTRTGAAPLTGDHDYDELAARFPAMTGANIRNAAIAGAFYAARDGAAAISQDHLVRAARAEYRSMGHVLADRPGRGTLGR